MSFVTEQCCLAAESGEHFAAVLKVHQQLPGVEDLNNHMPSFSWYVHWPVGRDVEQATKAL